MEQQKWPTALNGYIFSHLLVAEKCITYHAKLYSLVFQQVVLLSRPHFIIINKVNKEYSIAFFHSFLKQYLDEDDFVRDVR